MENEKIIAPQEFIVEDGKFVKELQVVGMHKHSLVMTFRKRAKSDDVECTGFDIKVYGETPAEMDKALAELEEIGKRRLVKEVE